MRLSGDIRPVFPYVCDKVKYDIFLAEKHPEEISFRIPAAICNPIIHRKKLLLPSYYLLWPSIQARAFTNASIHGVISSDVLSSG